MPHGRQERYQIIASGAQCRWFKQVKASATGISIAFNIFLMLKDEENIMKA